MSDKKKISVSMRYIDEELYDKIVRILAAKGVNIKTKSATLEYALEDYVNMMELGAQNNPYLIEHIRSIIEGSCDGMERRLGGRTTKIIMESAIQTGITNRLLQDYFSKFTDDDESMQQLQAYREASVLDLQTKGKPFSYADLIRKDKQWQD